MDIFDRAKAEETLTIGQKIRQLYAADLQFDSRANPPVKLSVLASVIRRGRPPRSRGRYCILLVAVELWKLKLINY